jgi:SAM-dependent methyltransferase
MQNANSTPLAWTGERMVPEGSGACTFWEHVFRYRFASRFANAKRVVDVACGEGYGSYAMCKAGATSVIGFDISPEACNHAVKKYGVDARCADATDLPIPNATVDLLVSFETIEHIDSPEDFVRECRRVLAPGGILILSTPNKDVYSEQGHHNSFHCSEMSMFEFKSLLEMHFSHIDMYSQLVQTAPWWSLRSLSAVDSPWLNIKGFWRFRNFLLPQSLGDGVRGFEVKEHERNDIVGEILKRDRLCVRALNPLEVQRTSTTISKTAKYLVAVCRT